MGITIKQGKYKTYKWRNCGLVFIKRKQNIESIIDIIKKEKS